VLLPEKSQIEMICRALGRGRTAGIRLGIGDDAAVLRVPPAHEILVTTDFSLEGVHFRREWHPAESVGHRCLARGLSDIAAMGGEPCAAFLSLALPAGLPQRWVDRFVRGLLALAKKHGVTLAGGDTAQSPAGVLADIVVVGSAPKGKAITRAGARAGDVLYVTGELGGSAAALAELYRGHKISRKNFARHFYPEPRVAIGRVLRERGWATAMIDLSDGLSTDLHHICEESGVGAEVLAEAIPCHHAASLAQALHGGEDYELLFTIRPGRKVPKTIAGVPVTRIGEIARSGVFLTRSGKRKKLVPGGWEHLRG
jgi:thiamine-monophosphate kinase